MPRKISPPETVQFSITLPAQAVALMKRLEGTGYFGASRGEVARDLILAHLRHLGGPAIADVLMRKPRQKIRKI
jgi:hypothetical protein